MSVNNSRNNKKDRPKRKGTRPKSKVARPNSDEKSSFLEIWRNADKADPEHQYIQDKQVEILGIRQIEDNLVIPVRNEDMEGKKKLVGLQYINKKGKKQFEVGSAITGNYYKIAKEESEIILIGEGYATVASAYMATKFICIVAFNKGNLVEVAKNVRERYPEKRIIILADNDRWTESNPGITASMEAAQEINGYVAWPHFRNITGKPTDFNDLHIAEDLTTVKEQILDGFRSSSAGASPTSQDLTLESLSKSNGISIQHYWLIEDIMEQGSVGLIFGEPASGKSFIALDLSFSIACGQSWHGHSVSHGVVIYIAGEGHDGIKRRFQALVEAHKVSTDDLVMTSESVNLLLEGSVEKLNDMIKFYGPAVKLIVIDTLNRNFGGGDENSSSDFSKFMNNIETLTKNRVAVLIVHHSGHGAKNRGRGTSAIKGAVDVEYKIEKKACISMSCTKAKDFKEPDPIIFRLAPRSLGYDDVNGNDVQSPILQLADENEALLPQSLSVNDNIVLAALNSSLEENSILSDDITEDTQNYGIKVVDLKTWKSIAVGNIKVDSENKDAAKKAKSKSFYRSKKKLLEQKIIAEINSHFYCVND